MPIKVVCITKTDDDEQHRVILEKATSPSNLIAVADRFLSLYREHGIANGEHFVGLTCLLDDRPVGVRDLIENASTAFFLLRQRMFGDCGFTLFKREGEIKIFMNLIMEGTQKKQLPPPIWTGKIRQSAPVKTDAKTGKGGDIDESGDAAILAAISKQTRVVAEDVASAVPETPPATTKTPRRMKAANFGALGQIGKPA
jgi:hypothetical protein